MRDALVSPPRALGPGRSLANGCDGHVCYRLIEPCSTSDLERAVSGLTFNLDLLLFVFADETDRGGEKKSAVLSYQ